MQLVNGKRVSPCLYCAASNLKATRMYTIFGFPMPSSIVVVFPHIHHHGSCRLLSTQFRRFVPDRNELCCSPRVSQQSDSSPIVPNILFSYIPLFVRGRMQFALVAFFWSVGVVPVPTAQVRWLVSTTFIRRDLAPTFEINSLQHNNLPRKGRVHPQIDSLSWTSQQPRLMRRHSLL